MYTSADFKGLQVFVAGGINHYIEWLKERVIEMHRCLKNTGSIFLHCDWHASAEIKVFILNRIFGKDNFRNEIVWCYSIGGKSKKTFGKKHDSIWFYTKGNNYTFNAKGASIQRKSNTHMKTGIDTDGREFQEKKGCKNWENIPLLFRRRENSGRLLDGH